MYDPMSLIDLEQYPINNEGVQRAEILAQVQDDLSNFGCAVLKGFLSQNGIDTLKEQADSVADQGFKSRSHTNPYFTKDDPSLPTSDPRRRFFDRSNSFIPADNFPKGSPLRSLYEFPAMTDFIRACLQEDKFYPYADPLADVIVNAAEDGNGFPWHFDTNNYTVTLAIQNADQGGAFEYAPNIRTGGENFPEVAAVLDGTSDKVRTLELEPGDLQIFKGRYSLHRVTPLRGSTPRYVAIFSYVEEPDMVATPERCKQLYGRALPLHYERAGKRADAYLD